MKILITGGCGFIGHHFVEHLYLNTDWDIQNGVGLVLYEGGIPIKKIHPIFPNFLVIDTNVDIEHELLKIQSDIKYTIVSFFHGKKNRF